MTHIAFAISTVLLWLSVNYVWSLIARDDSPIDDAEFDMTVEMSRSGGYSVRLIATGIFSAVVVAVAFTAFGYI